MAYFDYNATTPVCPPALQALIDLSDLANSSSVHAAGRKAHALSDQARESFCKGIHCRSDELIVTAHGTEANNTVLFGLWNLLGSKKNKIIISAVEHDSVLKPALELQKRGAILLQMPVSKSGQVDLEWLDKNLDSQTLLVSVMLANNETGMIFPVREIAKRVHAQGALFHTDAACAVGKMSINFKDLEVDYLTFSAHKFYAPKGIGGLVIKKGSPYEPLLWGGGHERGRRAGTEDVARVFAMEKALQFSLNDFENEQQRLHLIRQKIISGIRSFFPTLKVHESSDGNQLSTTLNLAFPGQSGLSLLAALDLEGIQASFGSACHSGAMEVSRVLLSMGVLEEEAASSIRISFGRMTTEADVEDLLRAMRKVL